MEKVITPLTINMRTLREAQNISAKEMAQYLGKAITTYRNYEAGFYPVPKELVGPIAERLGVTQEELLGGTPLPTSTERKKKEDVREQTGTVEKTEKKPDLGAGMGKGRGKETRRGRAGAREEAPRVIERKPLREETAPEIPQPAGGPLGGQPPVEEEDGPGMFRIEGTGTLFDEFYVLRLEPAYRRAILEYEEELPVEEIPEEDTLFFPPEEEVHVDDLFEDYFAMAQDSVPAEPPGTHLGLGLSAFERASRLSEFETEPSPGSLEAAQEETIEENEKPILEQEEQVPTKEEQVPKKEEQVPKTEEQEPAAEEHGPAPEKEPSVRTRKRRMPARLKSRTIEEEKTGQLSFDLPLFGGEQEEAEEKAKEEAPEKATRKAKEQEQEKIPKGKGRKRRTPKPAIEDWIPGVMIELTPLQKKAFHPLFHVQRRERESLLLEEIKAKVAEVMPEVDVIYVKPGENRAYWTKGNDSGFVTLWD